MQVFVRVADCGSFSRAAETLDLSNGTVTTCVRKLESYLGVTLIDRDTRRLRLTEQGLTYVQRCREVLGAVERAEDELRAQLGEVRGRLQVETTIALGRELDCPPRIRR